MPFYKNVKKEGIVLWTDFYIASGQEAMEQVANAERFINKIQDYLKNLGVL